MGSVLDAEHTMSSALLVTKTSSRFRVDFVFSYSRVACFVLEGSDAAPTVVCADAGEVGSQHNPFSHKCDEMY